jgi:ankyrin repeat protein
MIRAWCALLRLQVLSNLMRVKALVSAHVAKQDEERTNSFLSAASRGDAAFVRLMLQQGFSPDTPDYDGRTALMLACVKGHWVRRRGTCMPALSVRPSAHA